MASHGQGQELPQNAEQTIVNPADRTAGAVLAPLILVLAAMRPRLKRALPTRLHDAAGRAGRGAIRWLERHSTRGAGPGWHRLNVAEPVDGETRDRPVVMVTRGLQAGGAERQLVNLLRGLSALGEKPPLVLLDLMQSQDPLHSFFARELAGTRVEMHNTQPLRQTRSQLVRSCGRAEAGHLRASLSWAPPDVRADIMRLASELLRLRPAVVHGWQDASGIAAGIAGLAAGVPRIVISTRNVNPTHFQYSRPYMRAAYRRLADEPSVVLTSNSETGARDYARWLGLDTGRLHVIRNGVDDTALQPVEHSSRLALKTCLGLSPEAPVVGGIFRFQSEKRPLLWLHAARHVLDRRPDVHFVIFGGGTLEGRMRELAARLGLAHRLVLAGHTPEPLRMLSIFDVFLLTSSQEGTPNVLLEASLVGVPVVATDVGGTAEAILPGITGLLVRDERECGSGERAAGGTSVCRIADAVAEALESVQLRQSARREGPRFVRTVYGLDRMVSETVALYRHPLPG